MGSAQTSPGKVFGFDKDDLAANRQGRLTARQRSSLAIEEKVSVWLTITIGLVLAVIAVIA